MKKILLPAVLLTLVVCFTSNLFAEGEKEKVRDDKSTIKLRVVAVNPSKEKSQTVPIKIYLPKEVIPDDIISMGELKIGYDSSKGVYYSYSDGVELKPQETRIFEVSLEDIWKVKKDEIQKLKDETALALKHLEKTPHFANAKAIVDSIDHRLNEIEVKQNDLSISREEHIGAYRVNMMTMDQIKGDINIIEKMLQASGAPPSVEFLKDTVFERKDDIDRVTAWKLIFAIIGFVAFLGVGFYLKWFLAIKSRHKVSGSVSGAPVIGEHADEHSLGTEAIDISKLLKPGEKQKTG